MSNGVQRGLAVLMTLAGAPLLVGASPSVAPAAKPSPAGMVGALETVATFTGPMPTGVTVSQGGRIFVNFPRWGDPVTFTVAELKNGKPVAYPPRLPQAIDPAKNPARGLVSVQSVVVDPRDRLWLLDTGSVKFGPTHPGGPKLVGVDLKTNKVFKTITFPSSVALKTTYLNDVRFDLRRGKGGLAFITDSSSTGANGIVVVDLATGMSWRRLHNHASTRAVANFKPVVEGQVLMNRPPKKPESPLRIGSDGIAISADGERLFYCPLASHRLYSVSVDALADPRQSEAQVAKTVVDHGDKAASDGLESDAQNRVYVTDYEDNAVWRRKPEGGYELLARDPRLLWPDTLSLAKNGYLYVTANQLHRQPGFHTGKDLRVKPYYLFRMKVDGSPVLLK